MVEGDDVAVARDTVVGVDLSALVGELLGGQPCSQDALDGEEWRPVAGEIASAVGDTICAAAKLSFELKAAIVNDDASEVGDEIRFAGSFGMHGDGLRKRTMKSEEVIKGPRRARMDGKADLERDRRGKKALETTKLVEERKGKKRESRMNANRSKQKQLK